MPVRVQLQRRRGWRMPPNTVKVDRSTQWGNPLRVGPGYSAAQAVADYRLWLAGKFIVHSDGLDRNAPLPGAIRASLRGKNLACWCPLGQPCHADVLLALANSRDSKIPHAHAH
jgi:hypothetical protein